MNLHLKQHISEAYNWATGKTAREREHTRNRLIRELAQSITTLRDTPGLAAQARGDYTVRQPLAAPLMSLYKYNDADTRAVVIGALDAITAIDPVLAADLMENVTSYGSSRALTKLVTDKLVVLCDSLPATESLSSLTHVAIYFENLRDTVSEKFVTRANTLPPEEAFAQISRFAREDYMSAPKLVPALLALVAKEGATVEQKESAYATAALRGTYDQALFAKAVSDWESIVTKELPGDKGLKAAQDILQNYQVKNESSLAPLRQAAVRVVNLLAPKATDPEDRWRAAHGLLDHAPHGGDEWNKALSTTLDALDLLPLHRSVDLLAWFARTSTDDSLMQEKLAGKWAAIVARSEPEDLARAIMSRLYDRNDNYRDKVSATEHAILRTWVDIQMKRPVADAWRDAHRIAEQPYNSERNVLRDALRTGYLPALLVTLADKLPAGTALDAVHDAISIAENGPAAAGVARKWGTIVRGLEPQDRLKEVYRVAGAENAPLRAEADAIEKQTCKEFACGMTPQAFLSSVAGGPRV